MNKLFFVTATGTDVGKTFMVEKICRKLIKDGKKCKAIKPIISGFDINDLKSDSAKILKALGKEINLNNIQEISPWRFKEPLSPNIAANLEKKPINFSSLIKFCKKQIELAKKKNEYLFIEGAGGVMTPISNNKTFLDLIEKLGIPVILVTSDYLGTISHTLTAIKALEEKNIKIDQIIFNQRDESKTNQEIIKTLKKFTKNKITPLADFLTLLT